MSRIEVELNPFRTPNFVTHKMPPGKRQDGFKEPRSYALSTLAPYTLSEMCDEFRAEIFRKAEKVDPRQEGRENE